MRPDLCALCAEFKNIPAIEGIKTAGGYQQWRKRVFKSILAIKRIFYNFLSSTPLEETTNLSCWAGDFFAFRMVSCPSATKRLALSPFCGECYARTYALYHCLRYWLSQSTALCPQIATRLCFWRPTFDVRMLADACGIPLCAECADSHVGSGNGSFAHFSFDSEYRAAFAR